ncbi:MAG: hypothetical protein PF795_09700 [Kiritimatiellae bacterium]|nr:hypothetical protein [Kiritimatiellia bacterium]
MNELIMFNNKVIFPQTHEARLRNIAYIQSQCRHDEKLFIRVMGIIDFYEFYHNDMVPLVYFIKDDRKFHATVFHRIEELKRDWKAMLRHWYSPNFNEDCTEQDCTAHIIAEVKRLFVGCVIAWHRGISVACTGPQCELAYLPLFGVFENELLELVTSGFDRVNAVPETKAFISALEHFTQQCPNGYLPSVYKAQEREFWTREFPALSCLTLDQVFALKDKKHIESFQGWLSKAAKKRHLTFSVAESEQLADFMQEQLWDLVRLVEPNIQSTIVDVVVSNLPGLIVNPVSVVSGVRQITRASKLNHQYRGLFMVASVREFIRDY